MGRCRNCQTPSRAYYCADCRAEILGDAVMAIRDDSGVVHRFTMSPACRLDVRRDWKNRSPQIAGDRDALVDVLRYMARSGSAIVQVAR